MNESSIKISNPTRVGRILRRICQAGLSVLVRSLGDTSVAVKGRASDMVNDGPLGAIRISNVSPKGLEHLRSVQRVQVEFVMMSAKIVFISQIVRREPNSVMIATPQTLVSVERRKNARHNCTADLQAFVASSVWRPLPDDLAAAPMFPQHGDLANYLPIADLSVGGLCVVAQFPSAFGALRRGVIDDMARVVFPMEPSFSVAMEVRWSKRIKEHVHGRDGETYFLRQYRFGLEFINQSRDSEIRVRQFINRLRHADAI